MGLRIAGTPCHKGLLMSGWLWLTLSAIFTRMDSAWPYNHALTFDLWLPQGLHTTDHIDRQCRCMLSGIILVPDGGSQYSRRRLWHHWDPQSASQASTAAIFIPDPKLHSHNPGVLQFMISKCVLSTILVLCLESSTYLNPNARKGPYNEHVFGKLLI